MAKASISLSVIPSESLCCHVDADDGQECLLCTQSLAFLVSMLC